MSWAAHELESYVVQRHLKVRLAFSGLLLGSLAPDLLTKLPVYGVHVGSRTYLKATDAAVWHRGWPGAGFTTTFAFGFVLFLIALALTRHRGWSLALLIGHTLHVLSDTGDSVGTMLLFPVSTQRYALGLWRYSAQAGRYTDAAAYYSGLGGLWDAAWLAAGLVTIEVLRRHWFVERVEPHDPFFAWLRRRFRVGTTTLLAVYRAWFVYAAARIVGWTVWARLLNPERGAMIVDYGWGGPHWVAAATPPQAVPLGTLVVSTLAGGALLAAAIALVWTAMGRRLWRRASAGVVGAADPEVAAPVPV